MPLSPPWDQQPVAPSLVPHPHPGPQTREDPEPKGLPGRGSVTNSHVTWERFKTGPLLSSQMGLSDNPFPTPQGYVEDQGASWRDSEEVLIFIGSRRGRQCSPSVPRGWQRVGGREWGTYHTLATGTDAVGVPVAASGPIVYHLVHEDHVPCVL